MKALALTSFTATSCIGRGVAATLAALRERRTGLERCAFETVTLDAFVGEVAGVDEAPLPPELREYECRNNRLAQRGAPWARACRSVSRHQHLRDPRDRARLPASRPRERRAAGGVSLPWRAQHLLADGLRARGAQARRPRGGDLFGLLLERQGVRLGAPRHRGGADRCGAGGRGRLAVPHHALRLSLPAAGVARPLPALRPRARRDLDRRSRGVRAPRARRREPRWGCGAAARGGRIEQRRGRVARSFGGTRHAGPGELD